MRSGKGGADARRRPFLAAAAAAAGSGEKNLLGLRRQQVVELTFPFEKKESPESDFLLRKEEGEGEEEASEQVVGKSQVGVSFHHLTNGLPPRLVSAHSPHYPSLPQLPPTTLQNLHHFVLRSAL